MRAPKTIYLAIALGALLCACGGSSKPAVTHTLSMDILSQTPPDARNEVAEAYREHYRAELVLAHTEFQLRDVDYQLRIARAEKAQSKQEQKIAKLKGERSELFFMASLASAASAALNGVKKDRLAQGHRIRYLKSQRKYLRKQLKNAEAQLLAAEADFELAKAKLIKERKMTPKGFQLATYVKQSKRFRTWAAKTKKRADTANGDARVKEKAWQKASK